MSESEREASLRVIEIAAEIHRALREAHPRGHSKARLLEIVGRTVDKVSAPQFGRAKSYLVDEFNAPIEYDRANNEYVLTDPDFSLPLLDPTADDLEAVILAAAVLEPIVDERLNRHLGRLVEDMDSRYRDRNPRGGDQSIRRSAVTATYSSGQPVDPRVLGTLARAVGRHVVRINYYSPWRDETKRYQIEPWQLRTHDGTVYLRAYSRSAKAPRNYRVAQIQTCSILENAEPRAPRPLVEQLWAEAPAYGLDEDRPGTATVQIRGAYARWVAGERWHARQEDRWIRDGELLERTLPYRSCRELARRLLAVGDALAKVEPEELASEVRAHARAMADV